MAEDVKHRGEEVNSEWCAKEKQLGTGRGRG